MSILEFGQHESIDLGRDALGKADNVRVRIYNRKELIEELEGVLSLRHERVTKKQAGKIKTRTGASPARHTLDAVVEDLRMIPEEQYKLNETNRVRFNERAMRVFNSKAFTGALSIMQIVNFTNAVYGLTLVTAGREDRIIVAKNLLNTIGIGAQLSDSLLSFRRAHLLAIGENMQPKVCLTKFRWLVLRAVPLLVFFVFGIASKQLMHLTLMQQLRGLERVSHLLSVLM